MAELFTGFLAAIGAGGGAAAATGVTAGAAGAATGGLFSSFATIASIGSTVVGGLASMAAGKQQQAALNAQAFDEETKATQELIDGRAEALSAMRKLNNDLAGITVAGYASGLTGEGSVQAAKDEANRIGEQNISMARENAKYASAARRGQAAQLRIEGKAARRQGLMKAVEGGLSLFQRRTARG